jgi:hypothetical protein
MSVRLLSAGLAAGIALLAQQTTEQSSSWTLDVNGHRVEGPQHTAIESATGSQRVETLQSANGRMVPVQSTEDKVLNADPNNKVVERVIRKYDANGNPAQAIKVRIEEKKNPDGSTTIQSISSQTDVNGNSQVFERSTTEVRKNGATETATTVERATLNGGLQPVERDMKVERPNGAGTQVDATVYRRDVSGNFTPFAQDVQQITKSGGQVSTDAAHYEVGSDGKLTLYSRAVDHTTIKPDGSQVTDTEVYSKFSHGKTADINADQPRLQEQIHRESSKGPDGGVVETVSVRGRLPNDPSRFGTFEKVSETTYTSTDASGRAVKSSSETISRTNANGDSVVDRGQTQQVVEPKK